MKRRRTKQKLRQAEKALAGVVEECILSWPQAIEEIRERLGSHAELVLAWRLRLDPSWPSDRWLDGTEDLSLSIYDDRCLKADGVLWWGLLSDVAGAQTSETFAGTFRLSKTKRRRLAYELSFGAGDGRHRFAKLDPA
jgi:hypothetical protein